MIAAKATYAGWMWTALLALAACTFLIGITWGLPSRSTDPFLFGNRTPWTGKQILALAPEWGDDANRGADVAAHPLLNRDQPIILNQTNSQRAAIVRRYRLYSDQPDEMITLRALAQMKPGKFQFDPKLYQYGGLWIYPIGALFKIASIFRLVHLTPDLALYLDHPSEFGKLYIVMRLYSAAWGLIGLIVMFDLAKRISGSRTIGVTAALCYIALPTVINGAHEAKPHLAGAVLGLIAVDFAIRAVTSRKRSWATATGIACGAAASMVLSGWLSIGLLPVMVYFMCSWHGRPAHVLPQDEKIMGEPPMPLMPKPMIVLLASVAAAVLTYALFNPFVIIHLLGDRTVLESNLGNSAAMYQSPASIDGFFHGFRLLFESGSALIFFGLGAILFLASRRKPIAWLLLAAIVPGIFVFLLHATDKPGEYARFALPIDVLSILGVAMGLSVFKRPTEQRITGAVCCLLILPMGAPYVWVYGRETFSGTSRLIVAESLQQLSDAGASTIAVDAEAAPYSLPPIDLFRWKLVLLPRGSAMPADADVRIDPVDAVGADHSNVRYWNRPMLLSTPISWAGKPFRVATRSGVDPAAKGER